MMEVTACNESFFPKAANLASYFLHLGRYNNQVAHLVPELLDIIFSILDSAL